jgi:hypothetical protein
MGGGTASILGVAYIRDRTELSKLKGVLQATVLARLAACKKQKMALNM